MKKMNLRKNALCVALLLCVMFSCLPAGAVAADGVSYLEMSWDSSPSTLTGSIKTIPNETVPYYTIVAADTTSWNSGWYVVNSSNTINDRIAISGDVNLILANGVTLTAKKGIRVSSGSSLTIYAQSITNPGTLNATGNYSNAGIGTNNTACGNVNIHGGIVTATGGANAAGIGGGDYGDGGTVNIYGGTVRANGGQYAAGIGGGYYGDGGTVNIYGGTVIATGGRDSGTGIGRGNYASIFGNLAIGSDAHVISGGNSASSVTSIGATPKLAAGASGWSRTASEASFAAADKMSAVGKYFEFVGSSHVGTFASDAGQDTHSASCVNDCVLSKIVTLNCSGGTATCVSGAICGVCNTEYGETNPNNHGETDALTGKCALCDKSVERSTMILPADLKTIDVEAFTGTAAQVIVIPQTCTSIASGAFTDCDSLQLIVFTSADADIEEGAIGFGVTILAPAGGTVETWAHENHFTFITK